jgi:hypothetical protein
VPALIEWVGHRAGRYTFQMLGPAGPFYTRSDVVGNRLEYPAEAPALAAGVRYTVRVVAGSQPAQEAWFEALVPARAESLRADLGAMDQSLEAGTTDTTRVLLGAGLLASNGLMHDARWRVLDALATTPDEPALYQLLGTIYDRTGLRQQASTAFQEAQLLLDGGRPAAPASTPR